MPTGPAPTSVYPQRALVLVAALTVVLGWTRVASAIPVFARVYGKPCHACHTVYPQLNQAGEDFRLRGLHGLTPAIKPLKAGPYFEVPGTVPMAIGLGFGEDVTHSDPFPGQGSNSTRSHFNLNFLAGLFGGELSPHLAFLADYAPVVLKDARTGETDIVTRPGLGFLQGHVAPGSWLLNLRAGMFELPLGSSPRVHRLSLRPQLIYGQSAFRLLGRSPVAHGRADSLNLAATQIGAEASGEDTASGFEWAAGTVTGSNNRVDNNTTADFFWRLGYHPGALRAGMFFYYSPDTVGDGLEDKVMRFGPDVTFLFRRARFTAQFLTGRDSNSTGKDQELWYYGGFAEGSYRITTTLVSLLRLDAIGMVPFDDRDVGGTSHVDRRIWEVTGGFQYLPVENLKLVAEVTYAENHESVRDASSHTLAASLRVMTAFWPLDPPLLPELLGQRPWPELH